MPPPIGAARSIQIPFTLAPPVPPAVTLAAVPGETPGFQDLRPGAGKQSEIRAQTNLGAGAMLPLLLSTSCCTNMLTGQEDGTVLFRKLLCSEKNALGACTKHAWVDAAVIADQAFWTVFGGKRTTVVWVWEKT